MSRPDLRLLPLAGAGWAAMWLATSADAPGGVTLVAVAGVVLLAVAWALRTRHYALAALLLGAALVGGIGLVRQDALRGSAAAELAAERAFVSADVFLVSEPVSYDTAPRQPLAVGNARIERIAGRGRAVLGAEPVRLLATGDAAKTLAAFAPGSRLLIEGIARPTEAGDPAALAISVRAPPTLLLPPSPFDAGINSIRGGLHQAMGASPADQAALVPSLVVGDTSRVSEGLSDRFRATALTHLLAVSGANLTLMLGFLLPLVKRLGLRGRPVRIVAGLGVLGFVLLCRSEPSVLRAAAMGIVALAALGTGRDRAKGLRHLLIAIIGLLAFDPWLARSWGFALSVSATLGILFWASAWQEKMRAWAPGWLSEAICIPLAAQLATQPLVTALSGQVSVIGLLANAFAGPFVGPTTVLGLLAGLTSPLVGWVSIGFGWLAGWAAQPILWIAAAGSGLPAATWSVQTDGLRLGLLGFGCLGLASLVASVVAKPSRTAALLVALVVLANWQPTPLGWPGQWQAVFCDVGQGDSTVLRAGEGTAVLVDVGPEPASTLNCLRSLGVRRIALLVLTHYHADHIGGLGGVLAELQVSLVLVSRLGSPAHAAGSVRELVSAQGGVVREASPGERFEVGDVTWTSLYAGQAAAVVDSAQESAVENDASVVGIAEVAGLRIMLAGDSEPAGQSAALQAASSFDVDLGVHVLKLPHHGSSRQHEDFLVATRASLAIASAGRDNDYGHPAPTTVRRVERLGMRVLNTAVDGAIAAQLRPAGLMVRTQRR